MTLAGSIRDVLYDDWALTGDLEKANVAFPEKDWYDLDYAGQPQITVTKLAEPMYENYFTSPGGTLIAHSYPRFVVNCWLHIQEGSDGTTESQQIEDLVNEVFRIILLERDNIADMRPVVPVDSGTFRGKVEPKEPSILRYEITLIGAHDA